MIKKVISRCVKSESNFLFLIFLLVIVNSCSINNDNQVSYEYLKFITTYPHGDPIIIVPVYVNDTKEEIIISQGWFYTYFDELNNDSTVKDYSLYLYNILQGKIQLTDTVFNPRDHFVQNTKIISEFNQYGLEYIKSKYLKMKEYAENKNLKFYTIKKELTYFERLDLVRIMFKNEYVILESDIDGSFSMFKPKRFDSIN